jgi:hypothetical protein
MKYHGSLLALIAGIFISGCATGTSSGAMDAGVVRDRAPRNDAGDLTNLTPSSTSALITLQHPVSRVWPLVPSAYSVLEIPLIGLDTVNRVATGRIVGRRRFGARPMETLVDCGTSMTGPNAASYLVDIRLTRNVVVATPESARLRTVVEASGAGTDGSTLRCSSTGVLEKLILERVQTGLTQ